MASAADRLKLFKTLLAQARERLGLDLGFVLWDGSTVPADLPPYALAVVFADEGAIAGMIRRPKPDTLSNSGSRSASTSATARCSTSPHPRAKVRTKDFVKRSTSSDCFEAVAQFCSCRAAVRGPSTTSPTSSRASGDAGREQAEHPLSLRRLERLLRALARPRDGLYLRLLHRLGERPRPGPAGQARHGLPQAAARARRDACSTSAAAGARCPATRRSTTASPPTASRCPRSRSPTRREDRPARPAGQGAHGAARTIPPSRASSTRSRRSACSSMSASTIIRPITRP